MIKQNLVGLMVITSSIVCSSDVIGCTTPDPDPCEGIFGSIACGIIHVDQQLCPGCDEVQVEIMNLKTAGTAEGDSCAVAVSELPVGKVVEVNVLRPDGSIHPGFKFVDQPNTARSIKALGLFASGFVSVTPQEIPQGEDAVLRFRIQVPTGTSVAKIERVLREMKIASGSARADGGFATKHFSVWQPVDADAKPKLIWQKPRKSGTY